MIKYGNHRLSGTKLHIVWANMIQRCYNEKRPDYKYYGARGITVCDEWRNDFMAFYNWAIENNWQHGLTVDRKKNAESYNPDNCRIVSMFFQNRNKRDNRMISYKNETKCLTDWCKVLGLNRLTITSRIKSGLSIEAAFESKKYYAK